MQNSGETENELRPFLQRHDRPILERQRQGWLLLIPISGSGGCDALSASAHRSSPTSSSDSSGSGCNVGIHHLLGINDRSNSASVTKPQLHGGGLVHGMVSDLRCLVIANRRRQRRHELCFVTFRLGPGTPTYCMSRSP